MYYMICYKCSIMYAADCMWCATGVLHPCAVDVLWHKLQMYHLVTTACAGLCSGIPLDTIHGYLHLWHSDTPLDTVHDCISNCNTVTLHLTLCLTLSPSATQRHSTWHCITFISIFDTVTLHLTLHGFISVFVSLHLTLWMTLSPSLTQWQSTWHCAWLYLHLWHCDTPLDTVHDFISICETVTLHLTLCMTLSPSATQWHSTWHCTWPPLSVAQWHPTWRTPHDLTSICDTRYTLHDFISVLDTVTLYLTLHVTTFICDTVTLHLTLFMLLPPSVTLHLVTLCMILSPSLTSCQ